MTAETEMLRKLLRSLLAAPQGVMGIERDGALFLDAGQGRQLTLPISEIEQACAAGLITRSGSFLRVLPEARAYLRRCVAQQEEARFADQHRQVVQKTVEVDGERQPAAHNMLESPLGHLTRLKDRNGARFLPEEAVEAGERLAVDFQRGHLQPSITANWEHRLSDRTPGRAGGGQDLSDSALDARQRVWQAVDAMGPELSGVALDVCCFYKGLELVERERGWPARSAKLMLRTALLALARHYAPPLQKPRRHQWGAEDYRPEIGG